MIIYNHQIVTMCFEVIFVFLLFLGMVMYAKKAKLKQKKNKNYLSIYLLETLMNINQHARLVLILSTKV